MARLSRRYRLSRRGRRPLLQRAASLRPRRGRRAANRADSRKLPERRPDRRAHARGRQSPADDRLRAHAVQPPAIRRLDDRAHPRRRAPDRPGDGVALRTDPRTATASRTGVSRLSGHRPAGRPHGAERLEAAAERAIDIGARTYGSVKSILDNNLDRRPTRKRATDATPILHSHIRGPRYYN